MAAITFRRLLAATSSFRSGSSCTSRFTAPIPPTSTMASNWSVVRSVVDTWGLRLNPLWLTAGLVVVLQRTTDAPAFSNTARGSAYSLSVKSFCATTITMRNGPAAANTDAASSREKPSTIDTLRMHTILRRSVEHVNGTRAHRHRPDASPGLTPGTAATYLPWNEPPGTMVSAKVHIRSSPLPARHHPGETSRKPGAC